MIACSLCLGTGKVYHENPPRKDTPWSKCHCDGLSEKDVTILQQAPGAVGVLEREAMDGMSRCIQRLRNQVEQDMPPVLMVGELDLLEKYLANLRQPPYHKKPR